MSQYVDDTERRLWEAYHASQGSDRDRNALIAYHLGLVYRIAHQCLEQLGNIGQVLNTQDLVQEGIFGLMDAIAQYDPSYHVRLTTYAFPKIRSRMFHAVRMLGNFGWGPFSRGRRPEERSVKFESLDEFPTDVVDLSAKVALEASEGFIHLVRHLDDRSRMILTLRFMGQFTFEIIAGIVGVQCSRAHQLYKEALREVHNRFPDGP